MMLQEVGRLHAAKAAPKLLIHCTRSSIHLNAIHESAVLRKSKKAQMRISTSTQLQAALAAQ
jgi:hypothetical protein